MGTQNEVVSTTTPNPAETQTPVVTQSQPPTQTNSDQGKNIMIPTRAMKALKEEERKKGVALYSAELDKQAVELGFANHAAMVQHIRASKIQAPKPVGKPATESTVATSGQAPRPPKNRDDRKAMEQFERDTAKWRRENERAQQQLAEERRLRRRAERRADAAEARANLERIAAQCGVKKIGQAIYLYEQACQGKSVEELGQMDEVKFFDGLRSTDGYLFGEVTVPANTGTVGAVPGSHVPKPSATAAAAASAGKVDVMAMSKPQFEEYKRKRGISANATGLG